MTNVMMPGVKQREDQTGKALMIAGAIAGGYAPAAVGASGALAGAGAGAGLGGTASSVMASGQKPRQDVHPVQSAVQRRMHVLAQADQSLAALPPPQQQEYGPAIRRARMLAEQDAYA